jgi:NTP pyrophosphatase (non-canonical NTP hydrolase)
MRPRHLTFATLREGNVTRLPLFKNKHGVVAHSKPDGSDWSPAEWLEAVVGELGEYANVRKKYRRGDISHAEFKEMAAKELADVVTYLDILAFRLGIDLGEAVVEKFNEVSMRVCCSVMIDENGVYHALPGALGQRQGNLGLGGDGKPFTLDDGAFGGELDPYSPGAQR